MEKLEYLKVVDYYLEKLQNMIRENESQKIAAIIYEDAFADIAWTPYFLEKVYCLIQIEHRQMSQNLIDAFKSIYGKKLEFANIEPLSIKQMMMVLNLLERYLASNEEDYHLFFLKSSERAEKSRRWLEATLFNHSRVELFETELFQTLDEYMDYLDSGYKQLLELLKRDPNISKYRDDGTILAWIFNVLSIVNHAGFVLDRLDAQRIYAVLKLNEINKDTPSTKQDLPQMLKKAQKRSILKWWRRRKRKPQL
ncbi:hypothetical protein ACYSNR_06635 [Enterococcus sp. LJL128]